MTTLYEGSYVFVPVIQTVMYICACVCVLARACVCIFIKVIKKLKKKTLRANISQILYQ
jgi:hypothetical protein